MRKLLLLLPMALLLLAATPTKMPLHNAFLQDALNGNGKAGTNFSLLSAQALSGALSGTNINSGTLGTNALDATALAFIRAGGTNPPALQITNEVWVQSTANPYGAGLGTLASPYDGSTAAKFDALMAAIQTANTNGATVHLLGGTYGTGGSSAWNILHNNYRFIGSGIDVTTIMMTNNSTAGYVIASSPTAVRYTNIFFSDMTIDCNGANNSATNASGLFICGAMSTVERVKVIHQAGYLKFGSTMTNDIESFAIALWSHTDSGAIQTAIEGSGNVIFQCEVSSPASNFCSGICSDGGLVMGNRVFWPAITVTNRIIHQAFNSPGFKGLRLIGNYAQGGTYGFYTDSSACTNGIIADNVFSGAKVPLAFNGPGESLISVVGNHLTVSTNVPGNTKFGLQMGPAWNCDVTGNTITGGDTNTSTFLFTSLTNTMVHHNILDDSKPVVFNSPSNVAVWGNYNLNGSLAANILQTNVGNFLGTFVGNASVTNLDVWGGVTVHSTNVTIIAPNPVATWPQFAPYAGAVAIVNSNGALFKILSSPTGTNWTATNSL